MGLDSMMGLCLLDCSCTVDFCLFSVHLGLFDGLSTLCLIMAYGNIGIQCQLSLAGVHGALSHKQPLQGHIHLPLQLKHLI